MMAEKKSDQKWYGNGNVTADQNGKTNGGIATETRGRDDRLDMYKNDGDDNIWKRGKLRRIRHKEEV